MNLLTLDQNQQKIAPYKLKITGINFLKENNFLSANNYRLLILPLVYLILAYYGLYQNKAFFTTYPDSIYIYLVNATNIASGNFDIGHFDNPGTPVHLLGGLIIFITHLFVGSRTTYEDVFHNPEFYLSVCVNVVLWLFVFSLYFSSRYIYKNTKSSAITYLFQLLPICSFFTLHYLLLVRLCPENIIIIILLFYYSYLFVKAQRIEQKMLSEEGNSVLVFSLVSALLVTTKITTLPLLVFPLFYLPRFSNKIKYVVLTTVLMGLILFPVWPKFPEMYDWYTGLATRTGNYGQGEEGVKVLDLIPNFLELLKHDYFFTFGYIVLLLSLILGVVQKKIKNGYYKFIIAAFIVCSVQLLLASKQFGYHYLIASQLLIIPSLICIYFLFFTKYNQSRFLFTLFIIVATLFSFKTKNSLETTMQKNYMYESFLNAEEYKNIPKIITTGFQGSCFTESGLRFGASYGGPSFYYANYVLKKEYLKSYFYDMQLSSNLINRWDVPYTPLEFFQMNKDVLIYFVGIDEKEELETIKKITKDVEAAVEQIKLIKHNSLTGESFYMVTIDNNRLNCIYSAIESANFNFEKQSSDGTLFISELENRLISGIEYLSNTTVFSKLNALSVPPDVFVCCTTLVLGKGDLIDVSVKSFSSDRPVGITISTSSNPAIFNRTSESIETKYKNGWAEVSLHAIVPFDCTESKMTFCLFYWGKKKCYIDDLNITIKRNVNSISPDGSFLLDKKFILKANDEFYIATKKTDTTLTLSKSIEEATLFQVIDLGADKVALKTETGNYVCADRSHGNLLFANRKNAYEWETFELRKFGQDKISLKSSNNNFVGKAYNSSIIDASSSSPLSLKYIEIIKK